MKICVQKDTVLSALLVDGGIEQHCSWSFTSVPYHVLLSLLYYFELKYPK